MLTVVRVEITVSYSACSLASGCAFLFFVLSYSGSSGRNYIFLFLLSSSVQISPQGFLCVVRHSTSKQMQTAGCALTHYCLQRVRHVHCLEKENNLLTQLKTFPSCLCCISLHSPALCPGRALWRLRASAAPSKAWHHICHTGAAYERQNHTIHAKIKHSNPHRAPSTIPTA